jgi:F-type H+-transporting ATPase subunit delta
MAANSVKLGLRYARALLRAVEKIEGTSGTPTPAQKNATLLLEFVQALAGTPHFKQSLVNPLFSHDDREKALMSALSLFKPGETLASFIRVCFARDRINILGDAARAFLKLADEAAGVVEVKIITAREVDLFERSKVEMMITERVKGMPRFVWKCDPEILGGIIIKARDRVVDASINGRLERFRSELIRSVSVQ